MATRVSVVSSLIEHSRMLWVASYSKGEMLHAGWILMKWIRNPSYRSLNATEQRLGPWLPALTGRTTSNQSCIPTIPTLLSLLVQHVYLIHSR